VTQPDSGHAGEAHPAKVLSKAAATYARRPVHARDPFYAFWADGDPETFSPARLYFTDRSGARVRRLPETIDGKEAEPVIVGPDG